MDHRNRILHGLGALVAGGAERAAVDLMLSMKAEGLNVELVCMIPRQDVAGQQWATRLDAAGIPIHTGPTSRVGIRTIFWLRNLLSANDLALFHIHLNYVERSYCLSRKFHRRQYAVLRKLHNSIVPTEGWQKKVFDRSDIRLSVANGDTTRQNFEGKIKGDIVSIANGMNFHWPTQNEQTQTDALREIGLDPNHKHVVCTGSMIGESVGNAQKAQDTLIQAWQKADLGKTGNVLHLLGDGNLRPELEELARQTPSIHFHGVVPNIHQWLLASSVFVLPSRWEGLPNAAIEAIGTGTACLLSDIGPCKELNASHARYFKTDSASDLAQNLKNMLDAPVLGNQHRIQQFRNHYGMNRPTSLYLNAYTQALDSIQSTDEVLRQCNYLSQALNKAVKAQ